MLPFDNKSELQVLIDHDAGTPLETTLETARLMNRALGHGARGGRRPDLRRHRGALQLQRPGAPLLPAPVARPGPISRSTSCASRSASAQSHDLAKRVRPLLLEIAKRRGARREGDRDPAGPAGARHAGGRDLRPDGEGARAARPRRARTSSRPRRAWSTSTTRWRRRIRRIDVTLDREKAGLKGIAASDAVETIAGPGQGREVARLDVPASREPVPVRLRLSAADRASLERRLALRVDTPGGAAVALSELDAGGAHTASRSRSSTRT